MEMTKALAPFLLIQADGGPGSLFGALLPMIVVFAIFYFLVIRPQQRRQRQAAQEREAMLSALKHGDKVVTTGGIYGTIVAVRDDTITLRIAEKVNVEVLRTAIAGLQSSDIKEAEMVK
ncbi:MAG TPA: preprotein translocase subunit YajC [Blastocatellia bacterium]|nr:preprotein translocase subunit YajC [Blastocatellia bacterium]